MADFSNAQTRGRPVATAEIAIEGMTGFRPVLTCRPATEANPRYFNALLKRQRLARRGAIGLTADVIRKNREDDRQLLAELCVAGWDPSTVIDAKGKQVAFSVEECRSLFEQLPDHIFDDFRNEIADPGTFLELDDAGDVAGQAGN